jgi:hypothetical protein
VNEIADEEQLWSSKIVRKETIGCLSCVETLWQFGIAYPSQEVNQVFVMIKKDRGKEGSIFHLHWMNLSHGFYK